MATESQNLSFYIILRAYKAPYKALFSFDFYLSFTLFYLTKYGNTKGLKTATKKLNTNDYRLNMRYETVSRFIQTV
jgi:hypothetical protein